MRKLMDQMHRGLGMVYPGSVPRLQIARVPYSFEPMDEKPCKARVQNIPFIRYEDFFNSADGIDIRACGAQDADLC
jgi:hypothetical protein